MSVIEPPHGWDHALNTTEVVCRMFDFDADADTMDFDEVLDCWVEVAESAHAAAQRKNAPWTC